MVSIPLSADRRYLLVNYATSLIALPENDAALTVAADRAWTLVQPLVESAWPAKDMKVLRKYGLAQEGQTVLFRLDEARHDDVPYELPAGTWVPVNPRRYDGARHLLADTETAAALAAWRREKGVREQAYKDALAPYERLIQASKTFKQVVELWPEAEAMRQKLEPSCAMVALSDADKRRIAADMAHRASLRTQGAAEATDAT